MNENLQPPILIIHIMRDPCHQGGCLVVEWYGRSIFSSRARYSLFLARITAIASTAHFATASSLSYFSQAPSSP